MGSSFNELIGMRADIMRSLTEQRLTDLTDHLRTNQELLKAIETELTFETHPKNQMRYRRDIEELRMSTQRYQQELATLQAELNRADAPQAQVVAYQLQQIDRKLEVLQVGQAIIHSHLIAAQQSLLDRYAASEQRILETIVTQLTQQQTDLSKMFVDAIAANQLTEPEIQEMWAVLEPRLPELPPAQSEAIAEVMKAPGLDARHKLKVSFPLIPFLVDYEAELELGTGFNLKSAWSQLMDRLKQQPAIAAATQPTHKPIWQIAEEIRAGIPPEDLARLPRDGAAQHDHYIYGTPKRENP
jgi:hypothetical protein